MARTQSVRSAMERAKKVVAASSSGKYAASWRDDQRLPFPSKVFYRQAKAGGYGTIVAAVTDSGKPCALLLDPESKLGRAEYLADLKRRFPATVAMFDAGAVASHPSQTAAVDAALDRLIKFVELQQAGPASAYTAEALDLQRQSLLYGSSFQRSVWRAMAQVPLGKTCSYGDLARKAGHDAKATRAVAQACGANPLTLLVPCHRIVAQGGGMGGYHWGTAVKQKILRDEAKATRPNTMKLLRAV